MLTGGMYYLHGFGGNLNDIIKTQTTRAADAGGFKFAVGLSYRPTYLFELRVQPIIYYDFSFTRSSQINTRFYNPGLDVTILLNSISIKNVK